MNVNTPPHPTHPITSTWFASASTKRVKIGSSFHPSWLLEWLEPIIMLSEGLHISFIPDPSKLRIYCWVENPILTHAHTVRIDKPTMVPNLWFHMECSPIEESDPRWHFFSRNEGSGLVERQGSLLWLKATSAVNHGFQHPGAKFRVEDGPSLAWLGKKWVTQLKVDLSGPFQLPRTSKNFPSSIFDG